MIDILVYSERKEAIEAMVSLYVTPEDDGEGGKYWPGVVWDFMPPGTMLLKLDDPETPEEEAEYDGDNWYCNARMIDDAVGQAILEAAEAAYDAGDIKSYPSQRQPGVTHEFPYLNIEYEPGMFENVYFTRTGEGNYLPSWPRRIWAGGLTQ